MPEVYEVARARISLSDVDQIAGNATTEADIRAIWTKFVALAGNDVQGVLYPGTTSSARLADIYRVRAESHKRAGWECDGFDQSVRALEAEQGPIWLALLKSPHYLGCCFLAPERTRLIGFLFVRNDTRLAVWEGRKPESSAAAAGAR